MRALRHRPSRGVSLVEALVGLAAMAFGMLAIVGLQATMRLNADIAKQRSEAVRIAQEALEQWRAYTVVSTTAGQVAFEDIADMAAADVAGYTTNTTFRLSGTVTDPAEGGHKLLRVTVTWRDRTDDLQTVELHSVVSATPPAIAATLGIANPGDPGTRPGGRHSGIPVQARDFGDGRSGFKPSAGGTVAWVFNNVSGIVTQVCSVAGAVTNATISDADLFGCANVTAQYVGGFVRFADPTVQPDAAEAENPTSFALNLDVTLNATVGGVPVPTSCFDDAPALFALNRPFVAYHCLVTLPAANSQWTGISRIVERNQIDHPAWDIDDDPDPDERRICRYTPAANDAQAIPNRDHPRNYTNVKTTELLVRQNFLVIGGGFTCPTDVAADPAAGDFVNSNTLQHQPTP